MGIDGAGPVIPAALRARALTEGPCYPRGNQSGEWDPRLVMLRLDRTEWVTL